MKVCLLSGPSLLFLAALVAPGQFAKAATSASVSKTPTAEKASDPKKSESPSLEKATLAGGCFWCMEAPFDKLDGVVSVTVGYIGGQKLNPTYEEVSAGGTGHAEAVEVVFNAAKISFEKILDVFWHQIDPITPNAQFCDSGTQYRSAIFFHSEKQRAAAEQSKTELGKSGPFKKPIVTEITAATKFYPAEDYHQHYYKKNPVRYRYYRNACGRDQYLDKVWGARRLGEHP